MGVWIETCYDFNSYKDVEVTPCMGVWIETQAYAQAFAATAVTPCMGVWIETIVLWVRQVKHMSHSVWVCGLKLYQEADAGIDVASHPVWVCGLKPENSYFPSENWQSHPVWVCGLKQTFWISISFALSHTLYGCVD